MIDIIINEEGGVTIAHDEKSLDGFTELQIGSGGDAVLLGPDEDRGIGILKPSMLAKLKIGSPGWIVRMSGFSIARISPLSVVALS